jgi:glycosyltransferase involved in cell wall biosynthesis
MKTAIVVSSLNRPQILHETVVAFRKQTNLPIAIILSLGDSSSLLSETAQLPLVRVVYGPKGLTKQRNKGLSVLPPEADYVLFLDDDIEIAPNYIESMQRLFHRFAGMVVASGISAADGLRLGRTLTRQEAAAAVLNQRCDSRIETAEGAYGCNMFVRRSLLTTVRFDEGLPLDSWLEDYDFSVRCKPHGQVVWNFETCVAHIGAQRTSRECGFLVGYAQLANSHYLWRKGVIPSFRKLLGAFWLPALRVSLQGAVHGKPPWNLLVDYRGRVRGNAQALADAALLRLRPDRVLDFVKPSSGNHVDQIGVAARARDT